MAMKKINVLAVLFILSPMAFAQEFKILSKPVGSTAISFVQNAAGPEKFYTQKIDYAKLEELAPLSTANLAALKADDLRNLTMEEFNQLYARLSAGPMPLGDYSGYILQKPPVYNAIKKRVLNQAGRFTSFIEKMVSYGCGRASEDCLFEFIWKGKRFYPRNLETDEIQTRTTSNPISSGISKFTPDFVKKWIPTVAGNAATDASDMFSLTLLPMHVYCGISQVDARRESIITDGSFGDDFSPYIGLRDDIVTRKGLNISEEYRMVHPGLYIGKAYTNKLFLFNVALEVSGTPTQTETVDRCFDGKTTR
jgi:hypothetical protein